MASNDGKVLVSAMLSKSARPSTSVALGGSTGGSGSASVAAEAADDVHRVEYLLASIAMGDYLAFDELYTLFKNRVFGLAAKLLRDQGKAEEVTQEVFLQLWQQAARFDRTRGSAVAWILTHGLLTGFERAGAAASETLDTWPAITSSSGTPWLRTCCSARTSRRFELHCSACLPFSVSRFSSLTSPE